MTSPEPTVVGFLTVTATAEVRDKDGNLISQSPVELSRPVTSDELTEKDPS